MDLVQVIIFVTLLATSQPGSSLPLNCKQFPDDEELVCGGQCPPNISTEVKVLRCLDNDWSDINKTKLAGFNHLIILDLSDGRISQIQHGSFQGMENLEDLGLSNNKMTVLPPDVFCALPRLRRLDLSRNQLTLPTNAPAIISSHLQALDLSYCGLVYLWERTFSGLPALKELRIGNNPQLVVVSDCLFPGSMQFHLLDADEHILPKLKAPCQLDDTTKQNTPILDGFNKTETVLESSSDSVIPGDPGPIVASVVGSIFIVVGIVFYKLNRKRTTHRRLTSE